MHECSKPYDLIVEHNCEITEKVCQKREAAFKEIIQTNVSDRIEKTSSYTQSQGKPTKTKGDANPSGHMVQTQPNPAN